MILWLGKEKVSIQTIALSTATDGGHGDIIVQFDFCDG